MFFTPFIFNKDTSPKKEKIYYVYHLKSNKSNKSSKLINGTIL